MIHFFRIIILFVTLSFFGVKRSFAYSVLSHEAIIDACWEHTLKPLILSKFQGATEEQLKDAHAYAYGGCIMPDMGYYPFGSKLFTDLAHYVRSGVFVMNLINEAKDVNELGFALGGLCHYYSDIYGHKLGINICVPLLYPKVREKHGDTVTYADDKISHIRTEFAFDVLQSARENYASEEYHDFIGFKVSESLLERAFFNTYGLHLSDLFKNFSKSVNTFRWAVKSLFPYITKMAWATRKNQILKNRPGTTAKTFIYKMHKINYQNEFGKDYKRPGILVTALSLIIRVLPKFGPMKALKFKAPDAKTEKLFLQSFDTVVKHYSRSVQELVIKKDHLANMDYDTGKPSELGEYSLADKAYEQLLLKLQEHHFDSLSSSLKQNILGFYSKPHSLSVTRKNEKEWGKIIQALDQLKIAKPDM